MSEDPHLCPCSKPPECQGLGSPLLQQSKKGREGRANSVDEAEGLRVVFEKTPAYLAIAEGRDESAQRCREVSCRTLKVAQTTGMLITAHSTGGRPHPVSSTGCTPRRNLLPPPISLCGQCTAWPLRPLPSGAQNDDASPEGCS